MDIRSEEYERLSSAVANVHVASIGAELIDIEADPLYGTLKHKQWKPKSVIIDTAVLIELKEAFDAYTKTLPLIMK